MMHLHFLCHSFNKIFYRDRIARLLAPFPSHKNFNHRTQYVANANTDVDANANTDTRGSAIALPELRLDELKRKIIYLTILFAFADNKIFQISV